MLDIHPFMVGLKTIVPEREKLQTLEVARLKVSVTDLQLNKLVRCDDTMLRAEETDPVKELVIAFNPVTLKNPVNVRQVKKLVILEEARLKADKIELPTDLLNALSPVRVKDFAVAPYLLKLNDRTL